MMNIRLKIFTAYAFRNFIPTMLDCGFDLNLNSLRKYIKGMKRLSEGEHISLGVNDNTYCLRCLKWGRE